MEVEVSGNEKFNIENSIQESIKAKISLIEIQDEINKSIEIIYKKIKTGEKFYYVVMVALPLMHSTWSLNFLLD